MSLTAPLFLLSLALAAPATANPVCGLLDHLHRVRVLADALVKFNDSRTATLATTSLERATYILLSTQLFLPDSHTPDERGRTVVLDFIKARQHLVDAANRGDLPAIKAYALSPLYRSSGRAIEDYRNSLRCATLTIAAAPLATTADLPVPNGPKKMKHTPPTGLATTWRTRKIAAPPSSNLHQAAAFFAILLLLALAIYQQLRSTRRRRAKRYLCRIPALIKTRAGPHPIELLDISILGAKLSEHLNLHKHEVIRILLGGRWVKARVIWSNSLYAGVNFSRQISHESLLDLIAEKARRPLDNSKTAPEKGAIQ